MWQLKSEAGARPTPAGDVRLSICHIWVIEFGKRGPARMNTTNTVRSYYGLQSTRYLSLSLSVSPRYILVVSKGERKR